MGRKTTQVTKVSTAIKKKKNGKKTDQVEKASVV